MICTPRRLHAQHAAVPTELSYKRNPTRRPVTDPNPQRRSGRAARRVAALILGQYTRDARYRTRTGDPLPSRRNTLFPARFASGSDEVRTPSYDTALKMTAHRCGPRNGNHRHPCRSAFAASNCAARARLRVFQHPAAQRSR